MIEITLHHDRNFKSFKRIFPNAQFQGFKCGYWGPSFLVPKTEWDANKQRLPKSCTIDDVKEWTR
jgi:hypothetical protein